MAIQYKPFDKTYPVEYRDPSWPPIPKDLRRVVGHLFPDRATFAAFREALFDDGGAWDQDHEPGAYTDGEDDIWENEYPWWRNLLGIGTEKVFCHEHGLHIVRRVGNEGHHKFPELCVSADHGARFSDRHYGTDESPEAHRRVKESMQTLVARCRAAIPDAYGVRHAYVDLPESHFNRPQA